MRVLITGAGGFVGRHACREFQNAGWQVRALARDSSDIPPAGDTRIVDDLASAELARHFDDVDCVVHLAARAHRMEDGRGERTGDAYRVANVETTRRVAMAARGAGVRRFIFVSSAKVFGEERDRAYSADDAPQPADAYGRTKLEAEVVLRDVAAPMEVVVVRPPMVYGPGGKGNVPRLIRLARLSTRVPLPFGAVRNRRSVLYVGNLASALRHCATSVRVVARAHIVTDGEPLSTPELLRRIARRIGGRARFFSVPPLLLDAALRAVGRGPEARRLLGSLELDDSAFTATGWMPAYTVDAGLDATVTAWRC